MIRRWNGKGTQTPIDKLGLLSLEDYLGLNYATYEEIADADFSALHETVRKHRVDRWSKSRIAQYMLFVQQQVIAGAVLPLGWSVKDALAAALSEVRSDGRDFILATERIFQNGERQARELEHELKIEEAIRQAQDLAAGRSLDTELALFDAFQVPWEMRGHVYREYAERLRREFREDGSLEKLLFATEVATEAVEADENNPDAWVSLGMMYVEWAERLVPGASDRAENAFARALRLDPENVSVIWLLAERLVLNYRLTLALDFMELAVLKDPGSLPFGINMMRGTYVLAGLSQRGAIFLSQQGSGEISEFIPLLKLHEAVLYLDHFDYANARRALKTLLPGGPNEHASPILQDEARMLLQDIATAEAKKP